MWMVMLNTMALLRRRIFRVNRMITTSSGGDFSVPKSPWLMIQPSNNSNCATIFRFWCCAEQKEYMFLDKKKKSRGGEYLIDGEYLYERYMSLVGSSQGWLAYKLKCFLYLIDPTTYHCIQLPQLPPILRGPKSMLIISNDDRERKGKAFMIFGAGYALAFCWLRRRSRDWTIFGGYHGEAATYESIVYSSVHRRLFCITSTFKLEVWDVDSEFPRLDYSAQCDRPDYLTFVQPNLKGVKYLTCEEQTGELYLVVRNFSVDTGKLSSLDRLQTDPTVNFKVYKIDLLLMKIKKMDSLGGLSIFVGTNHPVAIKHVAGITPDSVYFTYDDRIRFNYYVGIFDYRKRIISPHQLSPLSNDPVWFTPTPNRRNI